MQSLIKPPNVKPGDTIAIVAPSGYVQKSYIDYTVNFLKDWGLEPVLGENLYKEYHQFAGTDEERLHDFQWAIDNEEVKAVLCARGGYGAIRIIDQINWSVFKQSPKWIAGFSDITVFHAAINNLGFQSIHSAMPINFEGISALDKSVELLGKALFEGSLKYEVKTHSLNRPGTEKAILTGGNLSLLYALKGTKYEVELEGKILFIEDVGEQYYHIDRMMQSLKLSGKIDLLAGLIVGGLSEMEDKKRPFGKTPEEIICDVFRNLDIPIAYGFPAGHIHTNYPLLLGSEIAFEVSSLGAHIKMN